MEGTQGGAPERLRPSQARRNQFLDRVRRYAHGPLLRRLGAVGSTVRIEPALHGERSLVYFVELEGLPRAVLRAEPKWANAWRLVSNLRRLADLGLPVPRLLAADRSPLTRLRWGFSPIVEERIEGAHADALGRPEGALRAIAATLAQFHNVQRRHWGSLRWPRWGSYRGHFLARLARRAADLDGLLREARSADLTAWFRERAATAPLDAPFSLIHGRVYPANFVVTPSGQAFAVDLLECRYGTFAADVAWALERLCVGDRERIGWFLDTYFAARPAPCREAFEGARVLFGAAYRLARAAIYARRILRTERTGGQAQKRRESVRRHVARLAAATGIEMAIAER